MDTPRQSGAATSDVGEASPAGSRNFARQNLIGRDFSKRILIGADFSHSDCSYCDFRGADLSFADFTGANLYRAVFSRSVLYVTYFRDCDLTRANFENAYIYGVKFIGGVNVTYATCDHPCLEALRRATELPGGGPPFRQVPFNQPVTSSLDASHDAAFHRVLGDRFACGNRHMSYRPYKQYEREMQLSQIHNRLKRIFKENHLFHEAGEHYYRERFWLTRSWFTTATAEDFSAAQTIRRFGRTAASYVIELSCGYGEKPMRVLGCALVLMLSFAVAFVLLDYSTASGGWATDFGDALFYSIGTFTTLGTINTSAVWHTRWLAAIEVVLGIVTMAVFTATVVRKAIRD
jgi:uncharacterized protein YjbI with pentapeptide repeats